MADYDILAVGRITLRYDDSPDASALVEQHRDRIEEIWQSERDRRGDEVFNGTLLSFLRAGPGEDGTFEVVGRFFEYKHFLAQHSAGGPDLGIKPIAVSGLLLLKSRDVARVVFGRRSGVTTQYSGFWELIPSGSIDRDCAAPDGTIDYTGKVLQEFSEETILPEGCVQRAIPFAFIYDRHETVYNVCCQMRVYGVNAEREGLHLAVASPTREYGQRVALVPLEDLPEFVSLHKKRIVPNSLGMIEAWLQWRDTPRYTL